MTEFKNRIWWSICYSQPCCYSQIHWDNSVHSVNLGKLFWVKGVFEHMKLFVVHFSGFQGTSWQHQLTVEVFCLEELLKCLLELRHSVESLVIMHRDAVLFFDGSHDLERIYQLEAKFLLKELNVGSLEVGKEVFSWISICLSSLPSVLGPSSWTMLTFIWRVKDVCVWNFVDGLPLLWHRWPALIMLINWSFFLFSSSSFRVRAFLWLHFWETVLSSGSLMV